MTLVLAVNLAVMLWTAFAFTAFAFGKVPT